MNETTMQVQGEAGYTDFTTHNLVMQDFSELPPSIGMRQDGQGFPKKRKESSDETMLNDPNVTKPDLLERALLDLVSARITNETNNQMAINDNISDYCSDPGRESPAFQTPNPPQSVMPEFWAQSQFVETIPQIDTSSQHQMRSDNTFIFWVPF
ncbi:hypothetical protein N7456_006120 [Penicillium angulare]|uniref:Uncharacterized protein n=1 Tax=Penicillium angulare TaxID=116970 RepID=A0A9W9G0N1_9EURO|nr:hypothetical protein N7456_006120 [Penicillium angulare]